MGVEQNPNNSLERNIWRGAGAAIALEATKLLITLPQPKTEAEALGMMTLGLLIPVWALWGEGRGWIKEDLSRLADFVTGENGTIKSQ